MFIGALKSARQLSLIRAALGIAALTLSARNSGALDAGEAQQQTIKVSVALDATDIDDQGLKTPSSPQSIPQDPGARTRSGHCATAQQADALESALGYVVLRVNIECCGVEGAQQAVMVGWGMQAAHDVDWHAPVLVPGADLRLAARQV